MILRIQLLPRVSSLKRQTRRRRRSRIMQVRNPRLGIRDVSNGIIRVVARKWYASARVVDPRVALNFWLIMQPKTVLAPWKKNIVASLYFSLSLSSCHIFSFVLSHLFLSLSLYISLTFNFLSRISILRYILYENDLPYGRSSETNGMLTPYRALWAETFKRFYLVPLHVHVLISIFPTAVKFNCTNPRVQSI